MFGQLYCRHVTASSATAEGGALTLCLELCGWETRAHTPKPSGFYWKDPPKNTEKPTLKTPQT